MLCVVISVSVVLSLFPLCCLYLLCVASVCFVLSLSVLRLHSTPFAPPPLVTTYRNTLSLSSAIVLSQLFLSVNPWALHLVQGKACVAFLALPPIIGSSSGASSLSPFLPVSSLLCSFYPVSALFPLFVSVAAAAGQGGSGACCPPCCRAGHTGRVRGGARQTAGRGGSETGCNPTTT